MDTAWVMQTGPAVLLAKWSHAHLDDLSPRGRLIWRCIPEVVCWSLWKERNQWVFGDVVTDLGKILNLVLYLHFSWLSHVPNVSCVSFHAWFFG